MRMHFVSVPVFDGAPAEAELNQFLATHRVLAIERQLVVDGMRSTWAICVSHVEGPASSGASPSSPPGDPGKRRAAAVDYRDLLPDDEFQVFVKLRTLRKLLADREGVPAYALFTNEQLAAMVQGQVRSITDLAKLDGVGKARIEKYGAAFVGVLCGIEDPTMASPATADEIADSAT